MLKLLIWLSLALIVVAGRVPPAVAQADPTVANTSKMLRTIRDRGHLLCGVDENTPGFAAPDGEGNWTGLNVDFCRGLAAAVLGSSRSVVFAPLSGVNQFKALQAGEVDILASSTAWTLSRDTDLDVRYVGPLFYNGQGILVPRAHALSSVLELSGASICLQEGTNAKQGVRDYFETRRMPFELVTSQRWDEVARAFTTGSCTVLTGDISSLALERSRFIAPVDFHILPEMLTKRPQGPVVRQGDDGWFAVVRWTMMALIEAEELGVTNENVDEMRESKRAKVLRLLGVDTDLGRSLGLTPDWAYRIVSQVGNYAQLFDRNLGAGSLFKLKRGLNDLWSRGGLMYAVPLK